MSKVEDLMLEQMKALPVAASAAALELQALASDIAGIDLQMQELTPATDYLQKGASDLGASAEKASKGSTGGARSDAPQGVADAPSGPSVGGGIAGAAGSAADAGLGALNVAAGTLAAAFVTGPVAAVGALTQGFQSLSSQIIPFVQAFSPATVMQFQQIMGDITAVIGQALEPVLEVLTSAMKDFGSVLGPLMEQLRPAFEAVAQVVATLAAGLVQAFAAMVPLIVKVADFLAFLAQGIEAVSRPLVALSIVFSTLWTAVAEFLSNLFGDAAKGAMDSFKDAMTNIARVIVLAVAKIAMALGQLDFVTKLQQAFDKKETKKEDIAGTKAAQNPALMAFDAFGAAVAKNASIATGGSAAKKPEDWLATISDDLKKLQAGEETILDRMFTSLQVIEKALTKGKEVYDGAAGVGKALGSPETATLGLGALGFNIKNALGF